MGGVVWARLALLVSRQAEGFFHQGQQLEDELVDSESSTMSPTGATLNDPGSHGSNLHLRKIFNN